MTSPVVPEHVLEGDVAVHEGVAPRRAPGPAPARSTMSAASASMHGVDVLEVHGPVQRRDDRPGGVGGADLEQLGGVLDRRAGPAGAGVRVEGGQARGELVDGAVAVGIGEVGPARGRAACRAPARRRASPRRARRRGPRPSGSRPRAAARRRPAPPGRGGCSARRFTRTAWVGREPHLVGDAADPLQRDGRVQARVAEGGAGPDLGQRAARLPSCVPMDRSNVSRAARPAHGPVGPIAPPPGRPIPRARPGLQGPSAEGLVGRARRRPPRPSGSTQRKAPDCPKWPNVAGDGLRGRPVRRLVPVELEPEAPRVGGLAAEAGQHPGEVGELRRGRLGEQLGREHAARACSSSPAKRSRSATVDAAPWPGEPVDGGGEHAEGLAARASRT